LFHKQIGRIHALPFAEPHLANIRMAFQILIQNLWLDLNELLPMNAIKQPPDFTELFQVPIKLLHPIPISQPKIFTDNNESLFYKAYHPLGTLAI
jgi:hypothetical protein